MTEFFDDREEGKSHSLRRGRANASANRAGNGPASFAIIRAKKLSSMGQIAASAQHTFRERETPNADQERTPENEILVGPDNAKQLCQAWSDRAPDKVRSNAVRAVEYLVTASPEAMKRMNRAGQDSYFRDALQFLQDKHGKENILSAVVHRDETTPHLSVTVIPLDDRGKLNARQFLGGRDRLRQMQTDFAEQVGKTYGFERGIENSRARHRTIRQFYTEIDGVERKAVKEMPQPPRYLLDKSMMGKLTKATEPIDEFEKRVHGEWRTQFAPLAVKAQRGEQASEELTKARQREVEQLKEIQRLRAMEDGMKRMLEADPDVMRAMQAYGERRKIEQERQREIEQERQKELDRTRKPDRSGPSR
jgi:hypothetical protein